MTAAPCPVPKKKIVVSLTRLVLVVLFFPVTAQSQFYKVDTLRFESPDNKLDFYDPLNNIFPVVVSEKRWKQASLINEYMQGDFLHLMPNTHANPFEAISPSLGEIQGSTDIDFTIENNSS